MKRFATRSLLQAGILAATAALAACTVYTEPRPVYQVPQPVYQAKPVKIPPGHYPPPGQCRVWYPDRPPGHQPPPGPCEVLQYQVPQGAVLVQG